MTDHVLITLDGSALAEKALDYVHLVNKSGRITLLTVIDTPVVYAGMSYEVTMAVYNVDEDEYLRNAVEQSKNYLDHVAGQLREKGYIVETRVEVGDPASVILDIATSIQVDAIIMSTHGRTGISRWLFGSVTQKVLSHSICPVLVIPGFEREKVDETPQSAPSPAPAT